MENNDNWFRISPPCTGKLRILNLPLKKQWFNLIASGEKLEEYREITDYWKKRLVGKTYDYIKFTLGYAKRDDFSRIMMFKYNGYHVGTGNASWGAENEKEYFVIPINQKEKIVY